MTGFAKIVGLLAVGASLLAAAVPARAADSPGAAGLGLLPVIDRLAQARLRDGALGAAAALRRRGLAIAIASFGCDSPRAAAAMTALALIDIDRGRYLDAEPLLIIAARILGTPTGDNRPIAAASLAGLARVALARGDNDAAEAWARRAVAVVRRNPAAASAEPLRMLGAALTAERRFAAAEAALTEALAQDRRAPGADAADTARSLSRLGNLRLRQGRPAEALPLIEQAAAIDQARLGPTHPFIADDFHDLGLVYEALNREREARRAFATAIGILERGAGRDTPRVAYAELELSRIDRRQGKAAAADAAFKDARRILNKAEAEEHRRERRV